MTNYGSIAARLDRIEKKLDQLLELSVLQPMEELERRREAMNELQRLGQEFDASEE